VRSRVASRGLGASGDAFVREVALTLARLMAYKDEYEVARLYADPAFERRLREQFAGGFKMQFHLAPPMLPGHDDMGRPKKRTFGGWTLTMFRVLRHFKFLRGTPFDPIGYFAERRLERQLIEDYRALIESVVDRLTDANLEAGVALAGAARDIAGYGPVKQAAAKAYEARLPKLKADFEDARPKLHSRAA
jgi:indolepyruvate ferredoxin oxidoreductase